MKLIISIILIFFLHIKAYPQAIYKSWDPRVTVIEDTLKNNIPKEFQEDNPCYIQSIDSIEHILITNIFPNEDDDWEGMFLGSYIKNWNKGRQIYINDNISYEYFKEDLCHEWGHLVQDNLFSTTDELRWKSLYTRLCIEKRLPTAYSYKNEYEGLADAFKLYCLNSNTQNKEEKDFIDSLRKNLPRKK